MKFVQNTKNKFVRTPPKNAEQNSDNNLWQVIIAKEF